MYAATFFIFSSWYFSILSANQSPSILVIGAGPSGIAAATRLLRNNFTNVKIFEAEGRIGGRIRSVKFGDAYVDLGAEWCHGEGGNIVYSMVRQYNVLRHNNSSYRLVYSNGSYVDEDVVEGLINFAGSIDASEGNPDTEQSCEQFLSIGECFDELFDRKLEERYRSNPDKLSVAKHSVDWLRTYMIGYDSTFSLYDLCRKSDYKRCPGDLRLNWNGSGYKTILEIMMQKYPDPSKELPMADKIFLNKKVGKITWKRNSTKVVVECIDGATVEVDHVIFTPSLGVLKSDHSKIFVPKLPEDKIKAIEGFGFGAVMKVALHFRQVWWGENEILGFVWNPADYKKATKEFGEYSLSTTLWLKSSFKFFKAENNPKIIMGFFAGEVVPFLEKQTDDAIIRDCMYLFKQFLGKNYTVIQPNNIIRSSWYTNSNFRGTYSYESVKGNSTGNKYPEKLGSTLAYENGTPAVLFAGEATHPYYFSTVHGAIETGYREADRIIRLYSR